MRISILHIITLMLFIQFGSNLVGQNNVGIGTKTPHLSAITQIQDSVRGLLIPRTDTMSIHNYVATLSPNPGIAHGLTIFETNLRQYYIYNGILQKWQPITSLVGPRGPTGVTGPTGIRGERGNSNRWRDQGEGAPIKINGPIANKISPYFYENGDTCGDYYHETSTGLLWNYNCDSGKWVGPIARWRNFGVPILESIQATGLVTDDHPADTTGNILSILGNLTYDIKVPPDTVAYVYVSAEGVVQKANINYTAFNKVAFDFYIIDDNNVASYANEGNTVSIGPNVQIVSTSFSQFDKVPWNMATSLTVEGDISPPGKPLPSNQYRTWTIQTHCGQFYNPGNPVGPSGRVIFVDNALTPSLTYNNWAIMNFYIVFERSPNAPYPQ